jgi:trimethylamine monooxygenase
MAEDIAKWTSDEEAIKDAFEAIDFQTEYVRDLLAPTDYPHLDVDKVAETFKEWEHHKMENILTYRDQSYRSILTGTQAPIHHTPWLEALDDSLETFLNQPEKRAAAE